jgi:adenosylcobyric acid synthase
VGAEGRIWGTYLHGIFHNRDFRRGWLQQIGWRESTDETAVDEYDRLADVVEDAVDWPTIAQLMKLPK